MKRERSRLAEPGPKDVADVQRLVAYPYDLNCSRHFILEVSRAVDGRAFLGELVVQKLITGASLDKAGARTLFGDRNCAVNIGITFRGLETLELEAPYLLVFEEKAKAFVEGAFRRAGRYLADTGFSAAERWQPRFNPQRAHLLLTLHANDAAALDACTTRLRGLRGANSLLGWEQEGRLDGCHLTSSQDGRTAHFGFRDGIAMPRMRVFYEEKKGHKLHEPGEFLLGYWNDYGFNPWLLVNPWPQPCPWLPSPDSRLMLREFFRNGSFGAFRMIEQNAEVFEDFVDLWAAHFNVGQDYVKAKLAGRWPDGHVVLPGEGGPRTSVPSKPGTPTEEDLDVFEFKDDAHGRGCPFGAHIRRMNPRDDPVVPMRRRPLIRRGMPYGSAYKDAPDAERGLLGMFFCASLEDQFEFLLREWGNAQPMGPPNQGTARDPFSAGSPDPRAIFDVPMPGGEARKLNGFPAFLTTRGTLYAFYPGLEAIGRIARCGRP